MIVKSSHSLAKTLMDTLDKLIELAQITGSVDIQCLFRDKWYAPHERRRAHGIAHLVVAGESYIKIEGEPEARLLQTGDLIFFPRSAEHIISSEADCNNCGDTIHISNDGAFTIESSGSGGEKKPRFVLRPLRIRRTRRHHARPARNRPHQDGPSLATMPYLHVAIRKRAHAFRLACHRQCPLLRPSRPHRPRPSRTRRRSTIRRHTQRPARQTSAPAHPNRRQPPRRRMEHRKNDRACQPFPRPLMRLSNSKPASAPTPSSTSSACAKPPYCCGKPPIPSCLSR